MHGYRTIWMAVGVAAVLAGCAPGAAARAGEASPLLTSLQVTRTGERVTFLLQVTNTSGVPVELNFRSGQSADFAVRGEGEEVWRWSEGELFTQALRREVVEPGDSRSYRAEWEPPAGLRGEFTAVGVLTAIDHRVEQAARFSLP